MRYFIVNKKTGKIEGNTGGYSTRKYAENEARLRWEFLDRSTKYVREVLRLPPGPEFAKANKEWFSDRYEIVGVQRIALKLPDGEGYIEQDI